jgi:hypothetical protein
LEALIKDPYNEKERGGFTNAEINNNVLEATLVKRVPISIQEFNATTGEFVRKDIFVFDEITFFLDVRTNLIYTHCSTSKLNKIKSALRNIIPNGITYENLNLKPNNIIDDLLSNALICIIKEVVIKKFIYKEGAQGKYTAQIFDFKIGNKLMEEYSDEIQKITFDVSSDDKEDFTLTISTNNSIGIRCEEDDFFCILDNLKTVIK